MKETLLAGAILFALMPSAALAYDGHNDPASAEHHYASMSHGCDLAMNHGVTHDAHGNLKAYMLLSAVGTCSDQDRSTVDACAEALPYEFADPGQDWGEVLACPLGSDIDTRSGQVFWQRVYRAYGLFVQGVGSDSAAHEPGNV